MSSRSTFFFCGSTFSGHTAETAKGMSSLAVQGTRLRCETSPLFQRASWMKTWLSCRCRSNLIAWLTAGMCAVKRNKSFIFDMLGLSQDWMDRLQGAFHCHFLFFTTQTSLLAEEEEYKEFSVSGLKNRTCRDLKGKTHLWLCELLLE